MAKPDAYASCRREPRFNPMRSKRVLGRLIDLHEPDWPYSGPVNAGKQIRFGYDPQGKHDLHTALKLLPGLFEWLAPRIAPYAPHP